MNQVYVFGSPSTVLYGAGCIEKVGERLAKYGLKHALIVTDDNLVEAGKVELLKGILASSLIDSCVYSGVNTETTNVHVNEGVDALRRNSCDVVIALGGGSPIDAAKIKSPEIEDPVLNGGDGNTMRVVLTGLSERGPQTSSLDRSRLVSTV